MLLTLVFLHLQLFCWYRFFQKHGPANILSFCIFQAAALTAAGNKNPLSGNSQHERPCRTRGGWGSLRSPRPVLIQTLSNSHAAAASCSLMFAMLMGCIADILRLQGVSSCLEGLGVHACLRRDHDPNSQCLANNPSTLRRRPPSLLQWSRVLQGYTEAAE